MTTEEDRLNKFCTPNWERELLRLSLTGHKHHWLTGHLIADHSTGQPKVVTKQCFNCGIIVPNDTKEPEIPMPKGLREYDIVPPR